jgi:hypothetical protein
MTDAPPNLQDLVEEYFGYDFIDAEAWAEWDRLTAEWQARRRERLKPASRSSQGRRA